MSENKPNDEPKLSTTDRVVKCKCNFSCHAVNDTAPSEQHNEADLEEFMVVAAAANRRKLFAGYGGRRVLAEL